MFVETGAPHNRAHFHAYYQEHSAVFAVDTLESLGGGLPKAQQIYSLISCLSNKMGVG